MGGNGGQMRGLVLVMGHAYSPILNGQLHTKALLWLIRPGHDEGWVAGEVLLSFICSCALPVSRQMDVR